MIYQRNCADRSGLTLIELLVVISVVAIMIGVLFPAVQGARESARIMQCQSNLRQLGLAAHQYEAAYRSFPTGGWGFSWQGYRDVGGPPGQPGGWTFSLLPFVEQQVLFAEARYNPPLDT